MDEGEGADRIGKDNKKNGHHRKIEPVLMAIHYRRLVLLENLNPMVMTTHHCWVYLEPAVIDIDRRFGSNWQ